VERGQGGHIQIPDIHFGGGVLGGQADEKPKRTQGFRRVRNELRGAILWGLLAEILKRKEGGLLQRDGQQSHQNGTQDTECKIHQQGLPKTNAQEETHIL